MRHIDSESRCAILDRNGCARWRQSVRSSPIKSVMAAWRHVRGTRSIGLAVALSLALPPSTARADNGGIGFWLPGTMGSLAAAPLAPGWSWNTIYLHLQTSAEGGREFLQNG